MIYDRPGVIFPERGPGIVLHLEGQAHVDDSASVGRTWRVLDLGETSTMAVVRTTFLDQNTQVVTP
ncbi:hypothetical protein [Streptomyces sp. NPDC058240]|uniref:hypothetical protein n=1 Tax=Streptomyces sp. NPDC058240 TaxID=3346396 RepID=UPI0036E7922F